MTMSARETEQVLDQFKVQYIRGDDQPRSRYFIRLEEAQSVR